MNTNQPPKNLRISTGYPHLDKIFTPKILEIITDHPAFIFKTGTRFTFHPPRTIIIGPFCSHFELLILHELGHALSEHKNYQTLIELLKIERAAWEQAKILAKKYHLPYSEDVIESHLDTYRNHLHRKSLCPSCGLTRPQDRQGNFRCPYCNLNL